MANAEWLNKDYYAELGLAKDASAAEVKKAYRKLARENHPDSNPGDTAKHDRFKKVAEAYDVVGDATKRKEYDEMRAAGPAFGGGGFGGGGFPGGFGGGGGGGAGGFDLSDLLGDVFSQQSGRRTTSRPRARKGADTETSATIGFTDAMDGVTISLRLASDQPCPECRGNGGKPGTKPHICYECEGAGVVTGRQGGAFSMTETCPVCGGRQLVYDEKCPTCDGSGRGRSNRTIQARIPAGVKDGQRIRLRGKGSPGEAGGPAGDLFVTVKVSPHRLFGRKGDNLTLDVPVAFDEAALGAEIRIPTIGGAPVTLKVPAGTPNGRTFRVRGRGAKRADGTNGDLLATIEVHVPGRLDDDTRAALEAYREARGETTLRANLFEKA